MGLPEISITFSKKASSAIKRSGRGMVVMILNDQTKEQLLSPYKSLDDVSAEDWTEKSYEYISMLFAGAPAAVVAVRAVVSEGTVNITETLNLIRSLNLDYLCYPEYSASQMETFKRFIVERRAYGGKIKAVLPNCAADYEGIINFATESVSVVWPDTENVVTYTAAEYSLRIAGLLAGISLTQSSTYYVLSEVVDISFHDNPGTEVDAGKLILIHDGENYKIARGVTSLKTVSNDHPEDFKKIKILEGSDIIKNDIYKTFEEEYVGKVNNTYDNKQMLIGSINSYFAKLYSTVLDPDADNYVEIDLIRNKRYLEDKGIDTEEMKEQEIKEANTGSNVYLSGKIKLIDAVEDLSLTLIM